jgi:enoyl-CoA hydratase/carnithine racemase
MDFQHLDLTVDGRGAARVRLHRPPANALDRTLMEELRAAALRLADDPSVRVVVLTSGLDRFFIAGADLGMIGAGWDDLRETIRLFHACGNAWEAIPSPTIVAINGVAAGGGCELALTCDFRIMSTAASIGLPEVRVGLLPSGGGTQRLPRLVGRGPALNLLLRGALVSAEEALRVGLVTEVCAPEELDARVEALAEELAGLPPLTVREIKRCTRAALSVPLDVGLGLEEESQLRLRDTQDAREGVAAFIEKRPPKFTGR